MSLFMHAKSLMKIKLSSFKKYCNQNVEKMFSWSKYRIGFLASILFLYIKVFPITPLLWLSPSYKIDPMSNLLFIKCSTIQNIIQTMVTYDGVDRLNFLPKIQVLEMAKNNICF